MASSTPNHLSIVVNGHVIRDLELKKYAERHGLCNICGLYQTHRRKGKFLVSRMEPLTSTTSEGVVTVYKGYCIQPTCYTSVDQVKAILGETTSKPRIRRECNRRNVLSPSVPVAPPTTPRIPRSPLQGSGAAAESRPISKRDRRQIDSGSQKPEDTIFRRSPAPPLPRQREHHQEISFDPNPTERNNSGFLAPPVFETFRSGSSSGFLAPPVFETPYHSSGNSTFDTPAEFLNSSLNISLHDLSPGLVAPTDFETSRSGSSADLSKNSPDPSVATLLCDTSASGSSADQHTERSATDLEGKNSSGKIRGDFDHLLYPEGLKTSCSIRKYNCPILENLDSLISDGDYIGFLSDLENKAIEPTLAVEGFAMFTCYLVSDQLAKPSSVILQFDGWVKTIKDKMERFKQDRGVVRQALITFLSISTLSGNYSKHMVKKGTAELVGIIDRYDGDQEIRELICAFIYSLSVKQREGLTAKCPSIFKVIRKLVEVVATNTFGQEYALRALFHLALQKKRSATGKMLYQDISNIISSEKTIRAMLDIINKTDGVPEMTVEAVMHLLCRVSLPEQEGEGEMDAIMFSSELISAVIVSMNQYESKILLGACCGFLSNLAMMPEFPREWAQPSADAICELLSRPQLDEGTTVCGSQALCNLLSDSARRALIMSDSRVITVVLECMSRFPKCEEVNKLCCLSIARACLHDQSVKAAFVAAGGLEKVGEVFHRFVTGVTDNPSTYVTEAALCAMASLSGCQEGARNITQTGLIEDLNAILAVETESHFVVIIQAILKNSRTGATNNFSSGSSDNLRQQPGRLPHLLRNADSQQAESILQDLLNLLTDSDVPNAVKLAPFADGGFDAMLDTMILYRDSSPIQEGGCGILAQVYYRITLLRLNEPARLPSGSWALIHNQNAIDAIQNAMRGNRGNAVLQEYACCALSNFLAPFCEMEHLSSDKQVASHWVGSSLRDVLDSMAVNPNEVQVHISAIHLFWILSFICNPDDLKMWTSRVLQQIFGSMRRFPRNRDLNVTACDTLMALQNDADSLELIGSATGLNALMHTLGPENEEVVVASSTRILASLLNKVYTASSDIMHNSEAIKTLILCMAGNQGNSYIQINICSILESIITLEDDRVRGSIGDNGGVDAICDALILHGSNQVLVQHACDVLSSIVPAAREKILENMRGQLDCALIQALQLHMENPEVQSAVMDVLSAYCRQDKHSKTIIASDPNGIGAIIQSMNLNVGSMELQRSGCNLIWVISGSTNSKESIGLQGGISAIVNGMLAHSDSAAIQKAGLAALKNLATVSCNKPLIASVRGEDAILYALWIHLRDPQIVSGALSALNNIVVDSETGQVGPMKEEVMQVVLIAMKQFSDVEHVQKNACFLLKSLSFSNFNLHAMTRSSTKLNPLLFHAAETFSSTCGDRARGVMSRMEECHWTMNEYK